MKTGHELSLRKNIKSIETIIQELGFDIRIGDCLHEFSKLVKQQPLRHRPAPAFTHGSRLDAKNQVLWMTCHDYKGELVCTQAIRLIDLGERVLKDYLAEHMWDIHPHGYDPKVAGMYCVLSDEASAISGRVTYHGELWLKGGPNGVRGGCLATLFTRLILLKALILWSPDYMIGLQAPSLACKGLGVRESYMRMEQRSVLWTDRQNRILLEGWLAWMSALEAEFNLRVPAELFYQLFEDEKPSRPLPARVA